MGRACRSARALWCVNQIWPKACRQRPARSQCESANVLSSRKGHSMMQISAPPAMTACGRFCCRSLFALAIKNSFGRRRDFRVKMWGTSSPDDKLTGDLRNVIEATSIVGRRSDFFTVEKLAPGNLRLLQQYRHKASTPRRRGYVSFWGSSGSGWANGLGCLRRESARSCSLTRS